MKTTLLVLVAALWTASACADVAPFPATFAVKDIDTNGATIHTRIGGNGPAVLMLHGFGESGDMWEPLAVALAKNHTVIVPDLRGMGLSSHPTGGIKTVTRAVD